MWPFNALSIAIPTIARDGICSDTGRHGFISESHSVYTRAPLFPACVAVHNLFSKPGTPLALDGLAAVATAPQCAAEPGEYRIRLAKDPDALNVTHSTMLAPDEIAMCLPAHATSSHRRVAG